MSFGNTYDDETLQPVEHRQSADQLTVGDCLGEHRNYRLEKLLGKGGMGHAWLAEERKGNMVIRKVVCKIIPAIVQDDEHEMEKLLKQFRLTKDLVHQNICPIYGVEVDPEVGLFFVMGYADGGSLQEWFHAQPSCQTGLPLDVVCQMLSPIADALDRAHQMGVVHRDVKPQNILLATMNQRLEPWLIDFGISAQMHETLTATTSQFSSSGTPSYMAPEQWSGDKQDARTDQYSLGVMAYEMLTGRLPFTGNLYTLGFQVLNTPAPPAENLSAQTNAVLQKVLSKDKNERFATCGEFVCALKGEVVVPHRLEEPPAPPKPAAPTLEELRAQEYARLKREEEAAAEKARQEAIRQQAKREAQEMIEREKREAERKRREEEAKKLFYAPSGLSAGTRRTVMVNGVEFAFRWIPAGTFTMGSPAGREETSGFWIFKETTQVGGEEGRFSDETQHEVTLTQGFWMMETQVTQCMWQSVMGNNPSHFKGDDLPVEYVSWDDCQAFLKKLNIPGLTLSLPTEAQWEYACRAGTTGPYAGDLNKMAWYDDNSGSHTHPVGQKQANAWGLYDMHGNVYEWCQDWYGDYPTDSVEDPTGPNSGSNRVYRGGGWISIARYCRSAYRSRRSADDRGSLLGFRAVGCPSK